MQENISQWGLLVAAQNFAVLVKLGFCLKYSQNFSRKTLCLHAKKAHSIPITVVARLVCTKYSLRFTLIWMLKQFIQRLKNFTKISKLIDYIYIFSVKEGCHSFLSNLLIGILSKIVEFYLAAPVDLLV